MAQVQNAPISSEPDLMSLGEARLAAEKLPCSFTHGSPLLNGPGHLRNLISAAFNGPDEKRQRAPWPPDVPNVTP